MWISVVLISPSQWSQLIRMAHVRRQQTRTFSSSWCFTHRFHCSVFNHRTLLRLCGTDIISLAGAVAKPTHRYWWEVGEEEKAEPDWLPYCVSCLSSLLARWWVLIRVYIIATLLFIHVIGFFDLSPLIPARNQNLWDEISCELLWLVDLRMVRSVETQRTPHWCRQQSTMYRCQYPEPKNKPGGYKMMIVWLLWTLIFPGLMGILLERSSNTIHGFKNELKPAKQQKQSGHSCDAKAPGHKQTQEDVDAGRENKGRMWKCPGVSPSWGTVGLLSDICHSVVFLEKRRGPDPFPVSATDSQKPT